MIVSLNFLEVVFFTHLLPLLFCTFFSWREWKNLIIIVSTRCSLVDSILLFNLPHILLFFPPSLSSSCCPHLSHFFLNSHSHSLIAFPFFSVCLSLFLSESKSRKRTQRRVGGESKEMEENLPLFYSLSCFLHRQHSWWIDRKKEQSNHSLPSSCLSSRGDKSLAFLTWSSSLGFISHSKDIYTHLLSADHVTSSPSSKALTLIQERECPDSRDTSWMMREKETVSHGWGMTRRFSGSKVIQTPSSRIREQEVGGEENSHKNFLSALFHSFSLWSSCLLSTQSITCPPSSSSLWSSLDSFSRSTNSWFLPSNKSRGSDDKTEGREKAEKHKRFSEWRVKRSKGDRNKSQARLSNDLQGMFQESLTHTKTCDKEKQAKSRIKTGGENDRRWGP